MPTTVDNRVVELKFDNRDFEKNTKQSMATLDKLKTSLDMTDAEKNFNKISKASDEVSFRKASESADTFSVKLSAMSAVAVSAIGRITSQLVDLGEQFIRNLSGIDYMREGFSKYEDIIGYQQTMLANAKNLSEEQMQELLDKLVWFSDETSFSADNMMQAMSSYIASGADELTAQAAALGTALWAALTGNSNESLAIANRNLPQIFGKGYMQLQDWQSIVTAKMDSPWIREMFIETAAELGTLTKQADGFYTKIGKTLEKVDAQSFTSTFRGGWLTTDVLMKTFGKITKFTDKVYDRVNETGELAFDVIRDLGKDIDDVGYKALKGAQETKTWTEAWDYVKGAVAAGWSRTFETLFGSFNTARDFFSSIVESLYSIFVEPGNTRNNIFKAWAEYTPDIASDVADVADDVTDIVTKLENARDIVISIIRGNYGNGAVRVKALAEKYGADAGRELQLVVNEVWKQWDGVNWSLNYEKLDELTANGLITSKTSTAIKNAADAIEGGADAVEGLETILNGRDDLLDGLSALAEGVAAIFDRANFWFTKDSSLKLLKLDAESLYNFTHKYAEKMRQFRDNVALPEDFDETMRRLEEGFYTLDDIPEEERGFYTGEKGFTAKWLYPLINNLGIIKDIVDNLLNPIRQVFKALKDGFLQAFFPEGEDTMFSYQTRLGQFLNKIKDLTEAFRLSDEQATKLSKIFQALFTPIKIVGRIIETVSTTVTDLMVKANKTLSGNSLLDKLLDIGEAVADVIIGFDEWLEEAGVIDTLIVPAIQFVSDALSTLWGWVKKLLRIDSESVFPTFDDLKSGWNTAKTWVQQHIIKPIEDTFHIDLHIPTWDEIMTKWGKIKAWVNENIVTPFSDAFARITGKKFEFKLPTFDNIKNGWAKVKEFVETKIIQPIEDLLGIDIRMPNLEDIKNFFSKIGEFFAKIFGGDSDRRGSGLGTGPVGQGPREAGEYVLETVDGVTRSATRAQSKASTLESILSKLGEVIKKIFTFIGDMVKEAEKNPMLNFAIKGGTFLVILEMISRFIDRFYNLLNIGNLLDIGGLASNLLDSVSSLFYALGEYKQTKAVKNLATSVAILVASVFMLALIPVESVREGVAVVLELVAAMGVIAVMMARTMKIGNIGFSATKNGLFASGPRSTLGNIGITLLLMAASVAILATSLKKIAKIGDPAKLQGALLIVEELLFSIVAVMTILNKSSKVIGKDRKLTSASIQFFAIGLLIKALVDSIIKLAKIENYERAFESVRELLFIVEGMVVLIAYFSTKASPDVNASNLVPKLVGPVVAITVLIVALLAAIAVLVKILDKEGEIERFETIAKYVTLMLAISVGIISALALMAKAKGATVKIKDGSQFIKMAAGISLLTYALSILVVAITASFAVLLHEIANGMTLDQMSYAGFLLAGIGALVLILVGVSTAVLQNSAKWHTSPAGLAAVGVVLITIAALVTSITLSFAILVKATQGIENVGTLAVAVASVVAVVGVVLGAVVLILRSFRSGALNLTDSASLFTRGGEFLQLLGVVLILRVLTKVISSIALALVELISAAYLVDDWTIVAASAISLAAVISATLVALSMVLDSLVTFGAGSNSAGAALKIVSLGLVIQTMAILIVSIAGSLAILVNALSAEGRSWTDIIAPVLSIVIVVGAILGAVAALNSIQMQGTNLLYIAGVMSILSVNLIAIATSLKGLISVVAVTGWGPVSDAVLAIAATMVILLGAAYIASNPVMEMGFVNLIRLFLGISTIAASFAVAIGIVLIALLAFKEAVYDIADHYDKFEKGVVAIFYTIAEAFEISLPILLSALTKSADSIAQALLEMGVQLAINIKKRLPDLIEQAIQSLIVALNALKDWIGPLVAVIFDFIVEVLEGVAYAINTRAGKIVAALLDIISSLIALTNTVISGVLSAILRIFNLDGVADFVTKVFSRISEKTIDAFADSGSDIIDQADELGKKIVKSSSRLSAYYEKYGAKINDAISSTSSGIVSTVSGSGNSISDAMGSMFDMNSLTGGLGSALTGDFDAMSMLSGNWNIDLDTTSLSSYGFSSGDAFSKGLDAGLKKYTVEDMFPEVKDYYDYGQKVAEAERSGSDNALITGLNTGQITTPQEFLDWVSRSGASSDNIDAITEAINKGSLTRSNFVKGALDIIAASDSAISAVAKQTKAIEDTSEAIKNGVDAAKSTGDVNRATGLERYSDDVLGALNALLVLNEFTSDITTLPDETKKSLASLRDVLATFEGPAIEEGLSIIDRLLGYSKSDSPVSTNAIQEYADAVKESDEYWMGVRKSIAADRTREVIKTERTEAKKRALALNKAVLSEVRYNSSQVYSEGIMYQNALNSIVEKLNKRTGWDDWTIEKLLNPDAYYEFGSLAVSTALNKKEKDLIDWYKGLGGDLSAITNDPKYDLYRPIAELFNKNVFTVDEAATKKAAEEWAATIATSILEATEDPSSPLYLYLKNGLFAGVDLVHISEGNANISSEEFMMLTAAMYMLGTDTAKQFVDGLLGGLDLDQNKDTKARIVRGTATLGNFMAQSTRNVLQIESPSKVAKDIGNNFVLGLAEGVEESEAAGNAAEENATSMISRLRDALMYAVNMDLDGISPVIRPILDLDAITAGASQIDSLVGGSLIHGRLGIGTAGYGDLNAIAQMNKLGVAQAIKESVLSQPVNQNINNTFNIQSNDPNEVARRVSAILSNQIQRKNQVWGPAKVTQMVQ